jgi:uncharacterized membrane protein
MATEPRPSFVQQNVDERRLMISRLISKAISSRSYADRIADWIAKSFGSLTFLLLNISFFVLWIVVNLNFVPGITPFDPFPFGLLTLMVSLEAIFLTIFVLISQTRIERIENLREDVGLHFEIITEEEITKLMQMTKLIAEKNEISLEDDAELKEMLKPIDLEKIENALEKNILKP